MNVIEYIKSYEIVLEVFENTFLTELTSFHFEKPSWESSATFIIMNKANVESVEKALIISVLQEFVRYGDFHFKDTAKIEIYNICVETLIGHYGNAKFELTEKITLKDCITRFFSDNEQRIYKNNEWDNQITLEPIKKLDWVNQNSLKTYHLKSKWNDEDYLFETQDYFIRFNWRTTA